MISGDDWIAHARTLVAPGSDAAAAGPSQIELRRAVSAADYGLFHTLALAGSGIYAAGGERLRFQVTRAFSHTAMRKVCAAYVRSPAKPFTAGLEHLNRRPPSPELIVVAQAFELLQEGRYTADYDLLAVFELEDVAELVAASAKAAQAFQAVRTMPDTVVFLTALLLADRWTRRG